MRATKTPCHMANSLYEHKRGGLVQGEEVGVQMNVFTWWKSCVNARPRPIARSPSKHFALRGCDVMTFPSTPMPRHAIVSDCNKQQDQREKHKNSICRQIFYLCFSPWASPINLSSECCIDWARLLGTIILLSHKTFGVKWLRESPKAAFIKITNSYFI